jgi:hypothetical protein
MASIEAVRLRVRDVLGVERRGAFRPAALTSRVAVRWRFMGLTALVYEGTGSIIQSLNPP